ncbi:MAG: tRNA (adenosine(37)-N6)-threonylcarbamoyltransferase complex dimerization subunit type 1 TsaB [Bacteroidales bacterium]|nr:tRNA (adenosine(37)-N6)-threonylcarbamoyltransferase complex dimerization subunit type 1 TsaB [Bacteroidales bacterium]
MILCIETSTDVCSVALVKNGNTIAHKEVVGTNAHAATLTPLIQALLEENNSNMTQVEAVAVSSGPGSYTGLRIGVSTAKGICYALGKPLIAVNSLHVIAEAIFAEYPDAHLAAPMIDARRMEVYTEIINREGEIVMPVEAKVIDSTSFRVELLRDEIYFGGNGSDKCRQEITSANAKFVEGIVPLAKNMARLAQYKYDTKQFESVAYFEPFYLKEFVATTPKNKVLDI